MADLYFMFGGDDEEELTIPVSNNLNHPDGKATLDTGYDNTKPKQATLDVEDDDVQRAVAAVLDAEEAAAKAEELANGVPMVHPDALLQQMQQQQQQQQRISEPNGSFKARLDAWYADDVEDDDDEEDEEDAERNGSNTIDDQADTTISLLDDVEQPLSPLEQIYLLLRSSTSSQRIDGIVQLPELLPEIPPSDAVDYCVDLIYSLADDSEDSVRCALAEQLDRILAYYFINCMLPTANNKDVDHHDDEEKTERSENEDEEDEDTKNSKNELPISTNAITTHADIADGDEPPMATHLHNSHQLIEAKLPSGSMVELIQKLLLDPVLLVADYTRDAILRLCDRVDIPFKVLHTEVIHGAIFALDSVEDTSGSRNSNGGISAQHYSSLNHSMGGSDHDNGFGFNFSANSMSGGYGNAPAVGRAACAVLGILAPLCERLDEETCEHEVLTRLVSWTNDSSYTIRRSTVPTLCAMAARLSSRRNELLTLYVALSRDAVWHVRQACAEHLDKLVPLIASGNMASTEPETPKSAIFPPDGPLPVSPTILAEPGNEHVRNLLYRPSLSDDVLERRAAWMLERYDIFLADTSRGVRESAWKAIGRLAAAFPRGQVPNGLVERYVAMPLAQPDENDINEPERAVQCAYNMPAMVLMLGADRWLELSQCYTVLVGDMQAATRCSLAHSLPVLASMLSKKDADDYLFSAFQHFMQDGGEVHAAALSGFAEFLGHLSPETRKRCLPNIIGWYQNGQRDWRTRETIVLQLVRLSELCSIDDIADYLLQVVEAALIDRVAQIRDAAVTVLAAILARAMYDQAPIARLLDALVRMSRHPEHRMRLLFLKVCGALVQRQLVSSVAMRDYLLPRATELAIDPVANIRLATVRLFRHIGRLLNGDRTLATFASVVVSRLRNDADRDVRSAVLDLEAFCPHRITLPQIERSASSNESIMNYEMEHAVDAYIHDMETVDLDIIEDELDDPMLNDTPLPMEVQGDYIHFDVEDFAEYCIKKNNDEVEAVNAPFLLEESDHISTLNLTGLKSYEDGKSNEDGNDTDDHATAASTLRLSLVSPTASEDSTVSPATPTSLSLPDYLPSSTLILSSDLNGMPTAKPLTPGTERTLDLESESTLEEENTSSTETSTITTEVEENVADTTNEPAPLSILTKLETTNDTVDDELESELIELNSPLELASLVNLSDEATLPADDVIDRGINGIKESTEAESTVHIPPIASDLHRTERRKSFEAASLAISSRRYSSDESRSTTLNKSIHSLNTTSSSIVATSPSLSKKVITNGILSPTNTTTATSNNTTNTNSPGKQSPVSDNGERDIDGSCSPVPSHSEEDNPSCVETDQRTDKNLMVPG